MVKHKGVHNITCIFDILSRSRIIKSKDKSMNDSVYSVYRMSAWIFLWMDGIDIAWLPFSLFFFSILDFVNKIIGIPTIDILFNVNEMYVSLTIIHSR